MSDQTQRDKPDERPVKVTFRFLPSDVPASCRLKKLLKIALRAFAMRCTFLCDAPPEEQEKPPC